MTTPNISINKPSPIGRCHSPFGSWENSFSELSKGLEELCRSSPRKSLEKNGNSPNTIRQQQLHSVSGSGPKLLANEFALNNSSGSPYGSLESLNELATGLYHPLKVRHEETNQKLQQHLSLICSKKPIASQKETLAELKDSLRTRLRLKVQLQENDFNDLVVYVTASNELVVKKISNDGKPLFSCQLSDEQLAQKLACMVSENFCLYIRECNSESLALSFKAGGVRYLPVVKENETSLQVAVIIHVPDEFRLEDISVKTVDDSLCISGRRRESGSTKITDSFTVITHLPNGTENRTVAAAMSLNNQLIVKGRLNPTTRRNTCDF